MTPLILAAVVPGMAGLGDAPAKYGYIRWSDGVRTSNFILVRMALLR